MQSIRNTFGLILFICLLHPLLAQEKNQNYEIGIDFHSLESLWQSNGFGVLLFKQVNGHTFNRFRLGFSDIRFSQDLNTNDDQSNLAFNLSLAYGREKRHTIGKKLQFVNGIEFGTSFQHRNTQWHATAINVGEYAHTELRQYNIGFHVGYLLGIQYNYHPRLFVRAALTPRFFTNISFNSNIDRDPSLNEGISKNISLHGGIGNQFGLMLGARIGK